MQLHFAHPDGLCPAADPGPDGVLGWRIGIRSADAYVPAAGSATPAGGYQIIHDAPPMPWPGWLSRRLTAIGVPRSPPCARNTSNVS